MALKKVRPVVDEVSIGGFDHHAGCSKFFFIFLTKFLFWTGLVPVKIDGYNGAFEFKLFSLSSILAFSRLIIFTLPSIILPAILLYSGTVQEEYEEVTGKNFTDLVFGNGLYELHAVENFTREMFQKLNLPTPIPYSDALCQNIQNRQHPIAYKGVEETF